MIKMYKTKTIDKVNALKLELDKKSPLKAEVKRQLDKKFRLEFNYNSNHLEGNTLTYRQTALLLLSDKSSADVLGQDIEEMKAHDVALYQIEEMAKNKTRPLTEAFIRELNKTILVRPFWKDAISPDGVPTRKKIEIGQYKTSPNSVRLKNGHIHEYASPEDTPALMSDLLSWYTSNIDQLHPAQLAAEFHYQFVCIHPFDDGNGRVARLIMNYVLLANHYPPVIIKSEDKENYLTALQKADLESIESIIEYIERQLIWSLELSLKAANGEDIEELADVKKQIAMLKQKKLPRKKIFKTPKVAYEIINHIHTDLWEPLSALLDDFNDFFVETKDEHMVDNHKIKKTKIVPGLLGGSTVSRLFSDREVTVKNYEIFGYDLEEKNVDEVQWVRKMLSLKSAKKKIDFEIICTLHLKDPNYSFSIQAKNTDTDSSTGNSITLFEIDKNYNFLFMSHEVNSIKKKVSKYLIEKIDIIK